MQYPGQEPISRYANSEGERVTINRATTPEFEGRLLLILWDDPFPRGSGKGAPTLLDEGLRQFLLQELDEIGEQ